MEDLYDKIFKDKTKILAVFAHPDDLELYCGGTIARLVQDGKSVRAVKVTSGNKGSREEKISEKKLRETRENEDRKAMELLGIMPENNIYLGISDGVVDNSEKVIGLIAHQIRIFQPDIVITHNPENVIIRFDKDINWVNHRDHRNTGISTIDAAYPYSRDLLFFPEHFRDKKAKSHVVSEFLLVDYYDHPDLVSININDYHHTRSIALACHSSQYTLKGSQETTDFFTLKPDGSRFETFRYVVAD